MCFYAYVICQMLKPSPPPKKKRGKREESKQQKQTTQPQHREKKNKQTTHKVNFSQAQNPSLAFEEGWTEVALDDHFVSCLIMAPDFQNLAENKPKFVEVYEAKSWRREDMSLLEFLRKSNKDGDIIRHIVEKHKRQVMVEVQQQTDEDDQAFARTRQDLLSKWATSFHQG